MVGFASVFAVAAAASAVSNAPIRISCVGDSITAGVCATNSGGYPAILQGLLGSNFSVTNYGNSGRTMLKRGLCGPPASGDCSYWDTPTWPAALDSTPDIVTIMLGTNDAKTFNYNNASINGAAQTQYPLDYTSMVAAFKALTPPPKVYLMIPPPLYSPYPYSMNSTVINGTFPVLIPKIAAAAGADGVINIYSAMQAAGDLTCDGCHPVDAGYQVIAQTMFDFLTAHAVPQVITDRAQAAAAAARS